ncbi:hypothetical protein Hdeb2414_s0008g00279371 [Helianthus debilis subsp. tardiflorus]
MVILCAAYTRSSNGVSRKSKICCIFRHDLYKRNELSDSGSRLRTHLCIFF